MGSCPFGASVPQRHLARLAQLLDDQVGPDALPQALSPDDAGPTVLPPRCPDRSPTETADL
jgi:hypothetical protein